MSKNHLVAGAAAAWLLLTCAAILRADLKVTIREYDVPTLKSRPHDPAVAPDGALWYTGQLANKLGRLDPSTGAFKEFPLKRPDSGPHGLQADSIGNVWFTANYAGYIGKLDPRTGDVTEYRMSDARVKDPHSLIIAPDGTIFFTAQNSNFVGRLDPKTGRVDVREVPTARANPYGIIIGPDGAPYFCEFGSNKIGRIDPQTLTLREFTLIPDSSPRRLTAAQDGFIYYTDYNRGFLGRLDPKTGQVKEWPSPAGAAAHPYGIAATSDGMIWYSESGPRPNTLVAFDPKTEKFQKWPIPSGGDVIRNMVATPDGRLYLACSGVNKVAVVTIAR
jgi:virginiamycin B lyase